MASRRQQGRGGSALGRALRWQPRTHGQAWLLVTGAALMLFGFLLALRWGLAWKDPASLIFIAVDTVVIILSQGALQSFQLHRRRKRGRLQVKRSELSAARFDQHKAALQLVSRE